MNLETQKQLSIKNSTPKKCLQLKTCLAENSSDATPLLNETIYLSDTTITEDKLYSSLFPTEHDTNFDELTVQALQIFCKAMLPVVERQLSNQLPGGKENQPSQILREEVQSAPLTNIRSKSDFSDLDRQIRHAPQKSTNVHVE